MALVTILLGIATVATLSALGCLRIAQRLSRSTARAVVAADAVPDAPGLTSATAGLRDRLDRPRPAAGHAPVAGYDGPREA